MRSNALINHCSLSQRAEEYVRCVTITSLPYGGYFMVLKWDMNYLQISNEPQPVT